jgi:glycosyltransferase involved in cell wall biosynthesis
MSRGDDPARPTIALLSWGNVIEDFLEPNGLTLETFCSSFRGSWMFGYVEALELVGVRTLLVLVSRSVDRPQRLRHAPTGAPVLALPPPTAYRKLLPRLRNPYGRSADDAFGPHRGLPRLGFAVVRELSPYLATPVRQLAKELRRERCRALLCQEYEFPRFDVCAALSRVTGMPLFASFQGGNYQRWRLERLTRGPAIRSAHGLVVPSAEEAERIRARYRVRREQIADIPNPVDVETWRPVDRVEARSELELPIDARIAVWHGRLESRKKGLDVLIDAWARVGDRNDRRLVIVGGGRDADALEADIRRRGLETVLVVSEHIHRPELLRQYLGAGDVYVFPSRHEGFPVALAEAMACGLPVVAADASGVADMLRDGEASGGIIVPREDAAALAGALDRLLCDPQMSAELGARARRRAVEEFAHASVGRRLRAFLLPELNEA